MSIPKEPRQLMINLMYLVLTALLALNVSAEVMNAFKTIDDSLKKSNTTTDAAITAQQKSLEKLLEDESKKDFLPLKGAIADIRREVQSFNNYVDELKNDLIDGAGDNNGVVDDGDYLYPDDPYKKTYIGKKNKDVTTRMLVLEGRGDTLQSLVAQTKANLVKIYSDVLNKPENAKAFGFRTPSGAVDQAAIQQAIDGFANNISLETEANWKEMADDKESWADFRFRQMPLISTLPLLTKFQADAKNAEALAVGRLAELAGGREIVFDKFFPVINAKKAYVIKGEKFEADISLGAYSSAIPASNIDLTVNGTRVGVGDDGKAKYSTTTSSTGTKTLKLSARVKNPLTGEVSTETSTFDYEVGVRSATVSADKMNVFYIGVDNPITVAVAGASSNEVKTSCNGCTVKNSGSGKYTVTAGKPGDVTINVSGGGLPNTPFKFRVKRIPDPSPKLGAGPNANGGAMGNGEFKAQLGLAAVLEGFDFDAKCQIQGFELTRVAKRQDPVSALNRGGRYDGQSKRLVQAAKPGDTYFFDNVKARCPGDSAGRKLPSIVFKIK